jgi:hypothetical protein
VTLITGNVNDIGKSVNLNLSAESASIVIGENKGNADAKKTQHIDVLQ